MKRILAVLLSVAMLFAIVPLSVFAQNTTEETTVHTDPATVDGTNGFGALLSQDIIEYQEDNGAEDADAVGGFAITDLTVSGNIATVEYAATETAMLVVSLYSEDGLQLLNSGNTLLSEDNTVATVTIEGTMPEYFMASAYIVDPFDYSPLCASYSTPMYTREMQELLSSTVEDYDSELILNLDDSTTTNFAVYAESTIRIDPVAGVNTIISIDEANGVYVIGNADAHFTSLREGDVFSYAYAEGEYLIAKVGTIQVDGTTVTIVGADLEMEEVFSHVKLEQSGNTADVQVDTTTMDDGVTYEGLVQDDVQTFAFEGDITEKYSLSYGVNKTFASTSDKVDGQLKLSGSLTLSLEFKLAYYISFKRQYIQFQTDVQTVTTLKAEGEISGGLPLGEYMIPIGDAISIGFKPMLQVQFSGEISATVSVGFTIGFKYEEGRFMNIGTPPTVDVEASAEGTIFVGVDMSPTVEVGHGVILDATLEMPLGVEVKASYTGKLSGNTQGNPESIHHCETCIDFTIYFKMETTAKLELLRSEKLTFSYAFTPINIKLGSMYWSFDYDEFGWGTCPHTAYRVSLQLLDAQGYRLSDAVVAAKETETGAEENLGLSNAKGVLVTYLVPGTYEISVTARDKTVTHTKTIDEAKKFLLIHEKQTEGEQLLGNMNPGTVIEVGNNEISGRCGDSVTYEVFANGLLLIEGTGEMYDYDMYDPYVSSYSESPWYPYADKITSIVIADGITSVGDYAFYKLAAVDSLVIGSGVTKIGAYAFASMEALPKVTLPDGLTSIGDDAFVNCDSLTRVEIPDGLLTLGSYAFSSCLGLTELTIPASVINVGLCLTARSPNVSAIYVEEDNPKFTSVDGILYNKEMTYLYQVPGGFTGTCVIPDGVVTIGQAAFYMSGVTAVVIPDSVLRIGPGAFMYCSYLKEIVFLGDAPETIWSDSFEWVKATAYYPPDNATWTEEKLQNYNGTITWVAEAVDVTALASAGTAEDVMPTEDNGDVSTFAIWGGDYDTEETPDYNLKTAMFSGLVAGEEYVMLSLAGMDTDDLLAPENLLYIAQGTAASDGTLAFTYVQWVDTQMSYVFACGASNLNLKDAVITFPTMVATNDVQTVEPTVVYGGKKLVEGVDYTISGVADYSAAGTYTCYIRGIYQYTGRIACSYTVVELPASGTCGEDLTWELTGDGALLLLGSGDMYDFADATQTPWYAYRELINDITVSNGITGIGSHAFDGCTKLKTIRFFGDAPTIGKDALAGVTATAHYSQYNTTWTEAVMQQYGGTVTWTGVEFPCEHTDTELQNAKTPTCQETGYSGDTVCKICKKPVVIGAVLPATGHSYTDGYCTVCGQQKPAVKVASGKCGTNLTWIYWDNGLLEISGTGAMTEYSGNYPAPWSDYRASITDIKIGSGVTTVGAYAFFKCSSLTNVVVPDNITKIGSGAFGACSSLESITLPFVGASVTKPTSTYQYPFGIIFGYTSYSGAASTTQYYYKGSLTSTTYATYYIPKSLKSVTITGGYILYGAFYNCGNITQIQLGDGVLGVEPCAFKNTASLTGIWVDENNPYYCSDEYGVVHTEDMTSLVACPGGYEGSYSISDDVVHIARYAFTDCKKLTDVKLGGAVTKIDQYAFDGCTALATIELNEGLTEILDHAFYNCSALKSLTVPESVYKIGSSALSGCAALRDLTIPFVGSEKKTPEDTYQYPLGWIFGTDKYYGGYTASQTYGNGTSSTLSGTYYIPSTLQNVTVTGGYILQGAFQNCRTLVNVVLTDDVQDIGESAFYGCTGLKKVETGNGVKSIGAKAFYGCTSLTEFLIGSAVTVIEEQAFYNCSALKEVYIPGTVTSVETEAFYQCKALKKVTVGSAEDPQEYTTMLADDLFAWCDNLTELYFGRGVNIAGTDVFPYGYETALWKIEIAENNPYICADDSSVVYTKDMKTLIYCPCSYEGGYTIPDGVTEISPYAFFYCRKMTSVFIADTVTVIGSDAFRYCAALNAVYIGSSVEKISTAAFGYCESLTSVTIPASVKEMPTSFAYCSSLTEICFLGSVPPAMNAYTFSEVTATAYYTKSSAWPSDYLQNYGGTLTWVNTYSPCKHSVTMLRNEAAATCAQDGYTGDTHCAGCMRLIASGTSIKAKGHNYCLVTEVTKPTCAAEGVTLHTCITCGDSYTETVSKLDHSYEAAVTAPTCTEGGYTTYTCTACGGSYTAGETEAVGHSYETVVTAPTCTQNGCITYTCSICGDTYIETVGKLDHSYESSVTAPTCTEQGYTTYTCECGDSYVANETKALGHTDSYVDNGDGTHDAICSVCGEISIDDEEHTYVDGTCACGAKDTTIAPEASVAASGLNLRLQDLLKLGFYFKASSEQEIVNAGALLWTAEQYAQETDYTVTSTIAKHYTDLVGVGGSYSVETDGIYAQYLDTVYYFRPYVQTEYGIVYGNVVSASALTYANIVYNGTGHSAELKSLVIDLLNYATAARTYFGYSEGVPAPEKAFNSILSGADKVVNWSEDMKAGVQVISESDTAFNPTPYGVSTNLLEAIALNMLFEDGQGVEGMLYWNASDYAANEAHDATTATGDLEVTDGGAAVYGSVTGIYAFQMYSNYYFRAYDAEGNLSNTYCVSVASYLTTAANQYANATSEEDVAFVNLVKAMMVYGTNAKTNPEINKG